MLKVVSEGAGLVLIPGGFSHRAFQSSASTLRTTDSQGHFTLPPDPAITEVVAAGPQGFAEAMPKDLAENPVINLSPWGRIEGNLSSNGVPSAGCTLSIGFGQRPVNISCGYPLFQAKTDDQGRFVFQQVPTGEHEITIVKSTTDGWSETALQPVTILTNQTTTITIDITNTIFGRMRTP